MSKFPLKTPLRYPGGKSKAVKTLSAFYPHSFSEYREPFIGGGSMAIYTAQAYPNVPIWINDLYYPLYNFWIQLRDNGENLSERIREEKQNMLDNLTQESKNEFAKNLFDKYQMEIDTYDNLEKAVSFFIMNKCSYSGLTENSTFSVTASNSNFSMVGAEKIKKFSSLIKNWKITNLDYSVVMNHVGEDVFVFLDPPYDIKDFLYGKNREMHKGFDHQKFAIQVHNCPHKFMITYNLNENILNLYKEYECREWEIRYSMAHRGEKGTKENIKKELLITNYSNLQFNPLEKMLYD
jgi:DNA adenine methylase